LKLKFMLVKSLVGGTGSTRAMTLRGKRVAGVICGVLVGCVSIIPSSIAADAQDRVAAARRARESVLRERFSKAGLAYPPGELFLRAFKHERELEVWARDGSGAFRKVATYAVTAQSGALGPKRREGDRQVPEGCYEVCVFNPASQFHLSLGINYPNASDRILSDRERPGGEIYIHGGAKSIGCIPIGDEAIEELYLAALDTRNSTKSAIAVHIFPARMEGDDWKKIAAEHDAPVQGFWQNLTAIYLGFERTRLLPRVRIDRSGAYRLDE
jgi:murein L,D-transpeptidase YafK